MGRRRRARVTGVLAGGAALVLAFMSAAFACGVVASLAVSPTSAAPGAQVAGTGKGFSNSHGGAPSAEPVVVHFDSTTGPVLWSGRPDTTGAISFTVTVPGAPPGSYAIIATQKNADGVPAPGTPARAELEILPAPTTTTRLPPVTTTVVTTPAPITPPPTETAPPPSAAPASTTSSAAATAEAAGTTVTTKAPARRAAAVASGAAATPAPAPSAGTVAAPATTASSAPATSTAPTTGARPDDADEVDDHDDRRRDGTANLAARKASAGDGESQGSAPALLGLVLAASVAASSVGLRRLRRHDDAP